MCMQGHLPSSLLLCYIHVWMYIHMHVHVHTVYVLFHVLGSLVQVPEKGALQMGPPPHTLPLRFCAEMFVERQCFTLLPSRLEVVQEWSLRISRKIDVNLAGFHVRGGLRGRASSPLLTIYLKKNYLIKIHISFWCNTLIYNRILSSDTQWHGAGLQCIVTT